MKRHTMTTGRAIRIGLLSAVGTCLAPLPAIAQDPTDVVSILDTLQDASSIPEDQATGIILGQSDFRLVLGTGFSAFMQEALPSENRTAGNCKKADGTTAAAKVSSWDLTGALTGLPSTNSPLTPDQSSGTTLSPTGSASWILRSDRGNCLLRNGLGSSFDPGWQFAATLDGSLVDAVDGDTSEVSGVNLTLAHSFRLGDSLTKSKKFFSTRMIVELKTSANYAGFYSDWSSTTYTPAIKVTHYLLHDETGTAKVDGAVGYAISNPSAASYGFVQAEVSRKFDDALILGPDHKWALTVKGSVNYRDYGETPNNRRDAIYSGSIILARPVFDTAELRLGLTIASRQSTDDAKDYDAISLPLTAQIKHKF